MLTKIQYLSFKKKKIEIQKIFKEKTYNNFNEFQDKKNQQKKTIIFHLDSIEKTKAKDINNLILSLEITYLVDKKKPAHYQLLLSS